MCRREASASALGILRMQISECRMQIEIQEFSLNLNSVGVSKSEMSYFPLVVAFRYDADRPAWPTSFDHRPRVQRGNDDCSRTSSGC